MRKIGIVIGLLFLTAMIVSCGKKEEAAVDKSAPVSVQGVKFNYE